MSDPLQTPLDRLPGVSPARLPLLARLGLATVGDLLFHFPRAYEDLTDLRPIARVTSGTLQTVQGQVVELDTRHLLNGGFALSVVLSDDDVHVLEGVWFNQAFVARRFRYGLRVAFSGKPRWYRDHWQMVNPRIQVLESGGPATPGIVPVYPLTEGLGPEHLRPLVTRALELYAGAVPEILPEEVRARHAWPGAQEAIRAIHQPESLEAAQKARRRFAYQELLLVQVALAMRRRALTDGARAPALVVTPQIDERIRRLFPFPLTADQDRALAEITRDLALQRPMQRLLQADVGAGKTAVALYALLVAVACKHQGVLMAPTEVLARQHARTLDRYLAHSRVRRLLLTGALSGKERREALAALAAGEVDLVVGTQALVQEGVRFARPGLVVIDEQHRFGVHQRAKVRHLGEGNTSPHYLVMTATPIPRTVALTVFGDLDLSVIRQLPAGRQPVSTRWMREPERDGLHEEVRAFLSQGRQAYLVCPVVDPSEGGEVRSAVKTFEELRTGPFRDFRVGLLHGRQEDEEKERVLEEFAAGRIDLLVCTTVVEVGIDVRNASLMVIEHAERFGLSQLHQLRGRVGRGSEPGHCWFFADPGTDEGRARLRTFLRTQDGFALAEEDARLRGTGELLGTRQHGSGDFGPTLAEADADLLERARHDALELVAADPGLRQPGHEALRQAVLARYGQTLELAEVG